MLLLYHLFLLTVKLSDFKQKAIFFNNYFASPIKSGNTLPNFSCQTEKILSSFDIKDDDIHPITIKSKCG